MRWYHFLWLVFFFPWGCNPPATFPNENPPTSCQNDTSCPLGQHCISGICIGSQTEGAIAEEVAESAAEPAAEPASEPASEPAAEPASEPAAEPASEPASEPAAEPFEAGNEASLDRFEPLADASEAAPEIPSEGPIEATPEIDPDRPAYCTGKEVCYDGIDNDCDGTIDNGCAPCTQASCPKDTVCSAGKCIFPPCTAGTCPNGLLCKTSSSGAKLCAPCANSAECPTGRICDQGFCLQGDCLQTSDCKSGKVCKNRICSPCSADTDCPTSQICEPDRCRLPDCKTSADCQAPNLCFLGRCRTCTQDADCGPNKLCENQVCIPGQCRTHAQCSGGKVCLRGNCGFCANDSECSPNFRCNARTGLCGPGTVLDQGAFRWADGTYASSCKTYFTPPGLYTPATTDGIYWIKPSSSAPFKVHCLMSIEGGGWTLTLKVRGDRTTFGYGAGYWTNTATLNPDKPDFDFTEAKLESFSLLGLTEILIYMRELDTTSGRSGYTTAGKQAASLRDIFAASTLQTFSTAPGRSNWLKINNDFKLQANCNREGFNVKPDIAGFSTRIGILGNDQGSCNSPDSFIGLGGDYSVGGASPSGNQEGFTRRNRMGYLYVR